MITSFKIFENSQQPMVFNLKSLSDEVHKYGFDDNWFYRYVKELALNKEVRFTCNECAKIFKEIVVDVKIKNWNEKNTPAFKHLTKKVCFYTNNPEPLIPNNCHFVSWLDDITIYRPTVGRLGAKLETKKRERRFDL